MRIGVISDTHIPKAADWLPEAVCEDLKRADLILHAGDLTEIEVLEKLKTLAPVKAVFGNMDDAVVQKALPKKEIITAGRFRIGLIHGWGPPIGLMQRVGKEFYNAKVDIIIYGHSHVPKNERQNGIIFFNPGSPTDKIFTRENYYGIIELNDEIKIELIRL